MNNNDFLKQLEEMSEEIKQHLAVNEQGKVIDNSRNDFSSNINAIRIYIQEVARSNPQIPDYSPKFAKEMLENMQTVLELSRFIDSDAIRNSQKKEDVIVAQVPEQMRRYQKIKDAYTFTQLEPDQLSYFKHKIVDKGIPYTELIPSTSNKCMIVSKGIYADQIKLCSRAASASSRSGEILLETMQGKGQSTFQISGLSEIEKGFYNVYIRDKNLEFASKTDGSQFEQFSYSTVLNTKDPTNIKYSVVFKKEDTAEHLKAIIMATGAAHCLTSTKGNAFLRNVIMSEAKEQIEAEGAIKKSSYSDVYICADSADMYVKLTKDGLELYSRGAGEDEVSLKEVVSRQNEKEFSKAFNKHLKILKSCGLKVVLDSEAVIVDKEKKVKINMQNTQERKKLLANIKTKRLSVTSYDEFFAKQLKRPDIKDFNSKKAFAEAQKEYSKIDLFNNVCLDVMLCGYIDRQSQLLADNPQLKTLDILLNDNNEINLISLTESFSNYAKLYASFMTIENKIKLYQEDPNKFYETYPNSGVPDIDAKDAMLEELTLKGEMLKQEMSTLQNEYQVPNENMEVFKIALGTMCGATFDTEKDELVFSDDLEKVQNSCKALENAKNELINLHQILETRIAVQTQSLEQLIDYNKENLRDTGEKLLDDREKALRAEEKSLE